MQRIHQAVVWHVAPVAMLGHRRTNLPAKFRVFLHVLALLSLDRWYLSKLLRSVVSVSSDYGTEVGLTRLGRSAFEDVLPYIHCPPSQPDEPERVDPDHVFADVEPAVFDNPEYFAGQVQCDEECANLDSALEAPDLMHVIHNCTKGLSGVMELYADFLEGLKVIAKFLSEKETKQQLLATCFSALPGIAWRDSIANYHGKVHEERWGTIAHAVRRLSSLKAALTSCWDLQKFSLGGPLTQRQDQDQSQFGHHLEAIDECINSDMWWGMLHVLHSIALVQIHVSDWVNSCPCHGHLYNGDIAADVSLAWNNCPLRGRRAAEVAAGDFFDLLSNLFTQAATRVESGLPAGLSPEQVLRIMKDFESARAHIISTYVLKLSFWSQPPYALAALAHYRPAARAMAVETCLASNSNHPLIAALKSHTDMCWAFLEGGALWEAAVDLGFLQDVAVQMRLMFTSAWRVEGQHARTKKAMTQAPNQTAAYVSLAHRLPELKAYLKLHPESLDDFAGLVGQVKNGSKGATLLGFVPKRAVDCGWLDPEAGQKNYKLIYHDDAFSKYQMALPSKLKLRVVRESHLRDLVPASELSLEGDALQLRQRLAVSAIRKLVSRGAHLSVPFKNGSIRMLCDLLAPVAPQSERSLAWMPPECTNLQEQSACAVVSMADLLAGGGDVTAAQAVFCSVLHCNPASFRRTKTEGALSLQEMWLVQLHRVTRMDAAREEVAIEMRGVSLQATEHVQKAPLALHPGLLSLADLKAARVWKTSDGALEHRFDNQYMSTLSPELRGPALSILSKLVKFPEGVELDEGLDAMRAEAMDCLVGDRLLEAAGLGWKLTDLGHERLCECLVLREPRVVLTLPSGELADATTYQLVLKLDSDGWTHEVVTAAKHRQLKKEKHMHQSGGAKVWYTQSGCAHVSRFYILALLQKLDEGVPYGVKDKDYKALLGVADARRGAKRPLRFALGDAAAWPDQVEDMAAPPLPVPPRKRARQRQPQPAPESVPEGHDMEALPADAAAGVVDAGSDELSEEMMALLDESVSSLSEASDEGEVCTQQGSSDSSSSSSSSASSSSSSESVAVDMPAAASHRKVLGRGFRWGPHMFTPVGPAGQPIQHWQCKCGIPAHNVDRQCTKKRSVKFGGEAHVLRLLKFWASLADTAPDQQSHLELWGDRVLLDDQVGNVPEVVDMDARVGEQE